MPEARVTVLAIVYSAPSVPPDKVIQVLVSSWSSPSLTRPSGMLQVLVVIKESRTAPSREALNSRTSASVSSEPAQVR